MNEWEESLNDDTDEHERHIIDFVPEDYEFSHYTKAYAVLKEGISKKKGDPIYEEEVEYIVPAGIVLKKKPPE